MLKLSINTGFGCPNRDGTKSTEGCIFCSENGSASYTSLEISDIHDQMRKAQTGFIRANVSEKYIAYFQAYTNTYSNIESLKKCYDTALSYPNIFGLMIGTRPDCIDENIADLISTYHKTNVG